MMIKKITGLLLILLSSFVYASELPIPVGNQFHDTRGQLLHAHGGGICKFNDYYYWFGENRSGDILISCYRSKDLKNWEFRNHILKRSSHSELKDANIERPKVIYNRKSGQFIMWAHKELKSNYNQARAAVAICNSIDGNYKWQRSFRPQGHMSRDCTLYVDDDGRAYFISSARNNYDLHIYRLTSDFLKIESLIYNFKGDHREAPAIFKHKGVYFLVTSGATGWNPNQAKYSSAKKLSGPWSNWKNFGDNTTYRSQPTYIQPIIGSQNTSYLYMGDRWAGAWSGPVNDSRYVWLPINIDSSNTVSIAKSKNITLDADKGNIINGAMVKEKNHSVIYINNATVGKNLNQFEYKGSWSSGPETKAYEQDNHWNGDAGEYYQIRFYGIQIEVYGSRAPNHGVAAISIDGGRETKVDYYADKRSDQVLLYTSPRLSKGYHTLRVKITGKKNNKSKGTAITADMVKVIVSDNKKVGGSDDLKGDVNTDGKVDIVDALLTAQYYVGNAPKKFNASLADVNCDNKITIVDSLLMARFYVALINGFC